jgi:nucleoid-associated protein YgaU
MKYQVQRGDTLREDARPPLTAGDWLLVPDLTFVTGHTVRAGETLPLLAVRWFGQERLWPIIAIVNRLSRATPVPGTVITRPRLNWRCTVSPADTLAQLAVRRYGNGGAQRNDQMVRLVAGANIIAADTTLAAGQVLFFPSFDPWD